MLTEEQNSQYFDAPNGHTRSDIFSDFNNTVTPYPSQKTIIDLFEEQVLKTPDNIALRWKDKVMTYQELNEQSNRLAHYLIASGVKQNDNIGILVTRSPDIMIGMFAIMKAGAAYVPIDPEYPLDRQKYIIEQSAIGLVIHNTFYDLQNSVSGTKMIQLGSLDLTGFSTDNAKLVINSHQLAYTIYTSGSTGRPKGVMIEHHSAVNLIMWVNNTFHIGDQDRLMFITSICFDLSVYDIFGILSSGGSIVIADQQEIIDLSALSVLLQSSKVTFWDSVPTTLDFLIRGLESAGDGYLQTNLRVVFLSGDWIPVHLPERIKRFFPNAQVISLGGATEATVWSNFYPIDKVDPSWKSIPYGRPIDNNFFYILDEYLKPVANGEQGDLFIGGVGVARGYANDKEKTDHSFIADPFNRECGGRMYRTGDIGRMLSNGNMEFLGRKDQQVKIRGFRVELGEIESVIRQYKFVDQVVVLAKDIDGLKRLAGYIVPKARYEREDMLLLIKRKLPDYMVPGLWMELDALPLNTNGKIDRNALPDIDKTQSGKEFKSPRNDAETQMIEIWQRILSIKEISVNDNFFDLGGQSLLAVQLLGEVEKKYNKRIQINTIFKYPTIELLVSHLVKNTSQEDFRSLVPIKATGSKIPLYVISGDGLNITNFRNLATHLDIDQPMYSLQPKGLDGTGDTFDNIEDIARHYINEILQHNPKGPYALAGYSFGGYVAIEMKRQLENMGKTIKMLGIFDTDADNVFYKKSWNEKLSKKIFRQFPKFLFIAKSFIHHPIITIKYQKTVALRTIKKDLIKIGSIKKQELTGIDSFLNQIGQKHSIALQNYEIKPFNGMLHLFKAKERIYFVDDFKYLGWRKFALDGVKVYDVPGDHQTMFFVPNTKKLGSLLQDALDNC